MALVQQLERKQQEIQTQLAILNEKIGRLQHDYVIETDAATKFKLEKQIEQAEQERQAREQELEALAQKLAAQGRLSDQEKTVGVVSDGTLEPQPTAAKTAQGPAINISVSGNANFDGVSFGHGNKIINKVTNAGDLVQADDSTVTITKATTTQSGMSITEVLKLFEQMLTAVNDLEGVPRKTKIEAKAEVEKAIAEIEEPEKGKEPDKKTVAEHLKNATATLKEAGATALQAAAFGKLVAQAVEWLGVNYQWLLKML